MSAEIIGAKNEPLKIQFITDVHYYARENGTEGKAYERDEAKSQQVIKDSDLVIEKGFDMLCEDNSTDIVVLAGDTTRNGEYNSHEGIIKLLYKLREKGKKVYVITSTHDYQNDGMGIGFKGDEKIGVPAVSDRHELWKMYWDFGPSDAISTHEESMSYVAQLAPGYRLFALNDDTNGKPEGERGSGYSDSCMKWIAEQLEDARKNDQYVIAMTHHPMISPSPFYSIIGAGDMQKNHETTREIFADSGLNCMLTGHTHIHNISSVKTAKGNTFYDISCSALIGCPPNYRNVTFDPKNARIEVETVTITDVPGVDTGGKSFDKYMEGFFFGMVREVIWAMGYDIDKLAEMTPAFSIPSEKVYKHKAIIKPVGKFLNKLTFKKIWRVCKKESGLSKKDIEDIKDNKVVDFIVELVKNLYCGDSPYTPDTREYKLTCGFLNVVDSFLKTIRLPIGKFIKGAESVRSLVEPLLWKDGFCDDHAVLPVYPLYGDDNPAPEEQPKEKKYEDTVKQSKKGPLILLLIILALLVLLGAAAGIIALIVWLITLLF